MSNINYCLSDKKIFLIPLIKKVYILSFCIITDLKCKFM